MLNQIHISNHIRIIHALVASEVAYLGFAVNVGSRDESETAHGMAHFVEHCLFKGTTKRNVWNILNRMENVGGELNAYTSKEETLVYSVFLEKDIQRAFELLSDLIFHSRFPENELKKEKEVILDEINSYEDSPSELIFDDFENMLFENHSLGHNILGSAESLDTFDSEKTRHFYEAHYRPENMVLFYMGKTDLKKIIRLAEKHIPLRTVETPVEAPIPQPYQPIIQHVRMSKDTHQAHVILGNYAYSLYHPKRIGFSLLNNMLGGPGMNSRLNVALRERSGLVYNVESGLTSFSDTGVFTVYFGTEAKNVNKCIQLVKKELNAFCKNKLTDSKLHAAKRQLMGQISIGREQREQMSLSMGKAFLRFGKYDSLSEVYEKIEKITANDLLEIANEIWELDKLSSLIYE